MALGILKRPPKIVSFDRANNYSIIVRRVFLFGASNRAQILQIVVFCIIIHTPTIALVLRAIENG